MTDQPWFLPAAFGAVLSLQLVLLVILLRLSSRVSGLSRQIAPPASSPAAQELAERKEATGEQKKLFAEFIAEDPSRSDLPKKEQFAEFRKWRDRKGLNWKGSGDAV
ncbi:hypothetical protein OKA04_11745 [Luteolibacter flavescens]|uniref:Uncharacterized protein n=1 Tax=Luteolibacter flavescens TaxID=1859460 RepID=A0ABT3FPA1_9BACT|nr:hypothetical protein [Luteolibacter flavescens]MCW1885403.1 hypothetical protein [Luteolibacter flavescens]